MDRKTLMERQGWSFYQKIDHSLATIDQFISRCEGKVYLAFSGGKDSTVLMHLCEMIKPDIKCVFMNTGCEYPDIVHFVRKCQSQGHNIDIIRPKMTPRQVWSKYGFPLASKEIAENVRCIRMNPNTVKSKKALGIINPTSMFVLRDKYRYLIDEIYDTSNKCCDKLKKEPSHRIAKLYGLAPIIGTMTDESMLRQEQYIHRGGG
ncbi:MAG: phosphoadenosine phosphosulfate reductase family protein, partial [Bacteroidaceae bacterium]|nr:phosphoadenosine phosphosulfate reductase family protein [Bacteroidaceae bacterium]